MFLGHRSVIFVLLGAGTVACTALLGDFEVAPGSTGGVSDGGDTDGSNAGVLTITPAEAKLGILRSATFTASGDVTWSIQEGPAAGVIDDAGKLISSDKPGVYHVVATSKADPSITASATATVVPLGLTVLAGQPGGPGNIDGPPMRARFRNPQGVAYIRSGASDVTIIADTDNHTIRKLEKGVVSTVAGTPGVPGRADGVGAAARFDRPTHVVADENGKRVWVLDSNNSCIRKVDIDTGAVTTFSGLCGTSGHVDGTGGAGGTARFEQIDAMVLGTYKDALYVCEIDNFRGIRRIDANTGAVTSPVTGLNNSCTLGADYFNHVIYFNDNNNTNDLRVFTDVMGGPANNPPITAACPSLPVNYFRGMTVDTGFGGANDIYTTVNDVVYRCDRGTQKWDATPFVGVLDNRGHVDGPFAQARLNRPTSLYANSPYGQIFFTDGNTVRRFDTSQKTVETFIGAPPNIAPADGPRNVARMTMPFALATDDTGNVFIADVAFDSALNNTIRRFDVSTATLTTLSGVPSRPVQSTPPVDGPKDQARFGIPWDLVRVGGDLFVADIFGNAIRKVSIATGEATTLAGELSVPGNSDGVGAAAHFKFFEKESFGAGLATDGTNLYVADGANFAIRKVVLSTGQVSTIAGGTKGSANGKGPAAQFMAPAGLAFVDGKLYVADAGDATIRLLDPATGEVTSFMGLSGQAGTVDGDASKAQFFAPSRIASDGIGNLYVVESPNPFAGLGTIRRIDLKAKVVSPFAGTPGKLGLAPGPLPATLNCPSGFALTPKGDLLVADACDGVTALIGPL